MNIINECKHAGEGKTITKISVSPNGDFWTLELANGSWIGFEPLGEKRVCMQYGPRNRPNDPSSPTPGTENVELPTETQSRRSVQRMVRRLNHKLKSFIVGVLSRPVDAVLCMQKTYRD